MGTYGCKRADAAANYRMQNPYRQIGMSNRAAANALNGGGSCPKPKIPGIDQVTGNALKEAAETGQGITKPELAQIVTDAMERQGLNNQLSTGTCNAINQAFKQQGFARDSTAQLALQLAQRKILPADIGARIGRAK